MLTIFARCWIEGSILCKTENAPDSFVVDDVITHLVLSYFVNFVYILYFKYIKITTFINIFANVLNGFYGTTNLNFE